MKIKDLKPSILEMPQGEAMNLIVRIRESRHTIKVKKKRKTVNLEPVLSPSEMSSEMASKLLEILGEGKDGT